MAKTYQLSNKGDFGSSLKIVPVTTETETNILKCLEVNGTEQFHISPQAVLPDLSNFKVIIIIFKMVSININIFKCFFLLVY